MTDIYIRLRFGLMNSTKTYPSSRFGSVVAHPDLDGEFSFSNPGQTNKYSTKSSSSPQPVLVIMSLSTGNALAINRRHPYLMQWTYREKGHNEKSLLSNNIKGFKTYELL